MPAAPLAPLALVEAGGGAATFTGGAAAASGGKLAGIGGAAGLGAILSGTGLLLGGLGGIGGQGQPSPGIVSGANIPPIESPFRLLEQLLAQGG